MEFMGGFGAGELPGIGSAGGVHGEIRIDDSRLMVGGGSPGSPGAATTPGSTTLYVEDVDAVYERALAPADIEKPAVDRNMAT
jgi:uncharacterized glyoxalase superfamily protein PhnB